MNILFIGYGGFNTNSAVHIVRLANALVDRGLDCAICVPSGTDDAGSLGPVHYHPLTYAAARRGNFGFADGRGPDLVHAWTPREGIRQLTRAVVAAAGCPYVVHLEDNEEQIVADALGVAVERLSWLTPAQMDLLVPEHLSHPRHYRSFLDEAAGVSVLIDRLLEFKPAAVPGCVVWPAFDDAILGCTEEDGRAARLRLGLGPNTFVVVYPGHVNQSNLNEIRSLYLAVSLLNRRGHDVRLVRFGTDHVPLFEEGLDVVRPWCLEQGYRSRAEVIQALAAADALVQPGTSNRFNDYRFPSKLPEFLASGRPVLLPRANIGHHLEDGVNAVLLARGNAVEIADRLEPLIGDSDRRRRIGAAGRAFAIERFSWPRSAGLLHDFYCALLMPDSGMTVSPSPSMQPNGADPSPAKAEGPHVVARPYQIDDQTLAGIAGRYLGQYPVSPVSYATVRDFCDSFDHLYPLATTNRDMKDVQRPWMLKALLGTVPPGGRLLEIGAGEPMVASLLARLGYEVFVVDPYDGTGNGPQEYQKFCENYPEVRILRSFFTDATPGLEPASFDAIYSISVLEHVPTDHLGPLVSGLTRFTRPGGWTIHAVDHVYRGAGSASHVQRLNRLFELLNQSPCNLDKLLGRLSDDTETYYLSAESHNLWRGSVPYEEFPMRVCVSLQFAWRLGLDGGSASEEAEEFA